MVKNPTTASKIAEKRITTTLANEAPRADAPIRLIAPNVLHVRVKEVQGAKIMPGKRNGEMVTEHNYRAEAIQYARTIIERQVLPAGVETWKLRNAFRFATGKVPADILRSFGLGDMASFGDVFEIIDRQLINPRPKNSEGTYGGFSAGTPVRGFPKGGGFNRGR